MLVGIGFQAAFLPQARQPARYPVRIMTLPQVRLLTDRLPAGPWIFGRQVDEPSGVENGALVEIQDASDRFVGHGLYNSSSDIRIRVLSGGRRSAWDRPVDVLRQMIARSARLRSKTLRLGDHSDMWRVVHAEGDDLPGLIVDRMGDCYVVEHHALGFWRLRKEIEKALLAIADGATVIHRVPKNVRNLENFEPEEEEVTVEGRWLNEGGISYPVIPGYGHKTGWFCDQRDNRQTIGALCRGRVVLDLCCNAGGFALQAAKHGAHSVTAVDLDEDVLERARMAAEQNQFEVTLEHEDIFHNLRRRAHEGQRAEVVILDPHKMIRGRSSLEEGKEKYLDMNTLALGAVSQGGLLATYSCSGALDLPSFLGVLFQAARRAERTVKILAIQGAGPDHPQRPDFPRSRYLKGALLFVD